MYQLLTQCLSALTLKKPRNYTQSITGVDCAWKMRRHLNGHLPQTKDSTNLKAIVDSFSVQARKQPTPGILSRKGFRRGSWVLTKRQRHQGLIQTCALWPCHDSCHPEVRACSCLVTHTMKQVTRQWGLGPATANIYVCQSLLNHHCPNLLGKIIPKACVDMFNW